MPYAALWCRGTVRAVEEAGVVVQIQVQRTEVDGNYFDMVRVPRHHVVLLV